MQQINQKTTFEIDLRPEEDCTFNFAFEQMFLQAVDSTFSMLGDKAKEVMFRYLEKRLGAERNAIGRDPDAFEAAVSAIFGEAALVIEMQIIRALHGKNPKFKYKGRGNEFTFNDYVKEFRRIV